MYANSPQKNVTQTPQNENFNYETQGHCPINSVTESASLKSLQSHGGDEVTAASRREYLRIMSERYQVACRKEKRIILTEL